MFCCTLLYVPSSFGIILMGKRELVALLSLSSCCLAIVVWLFLAVPWVCLQFVIVVFPDHTHYFLTMRQSKSCLFKTNQRHCIVSFSKTLYPLLRTGSTQEDRKLSPHDCKIVNWDVKHQHKQVLGHNFFIS